MGESQCILCAMMNLPIALDGVFVAMQFGVAIFLDSMWGRHCVLWALFSLVLTTVLGVHLKEWENEVQGIC